MAAMKDLVIAIIEALEETHMDVEGVADRFNVDPTFVMDVAREYGDI